MTREQINAFEKISKGAWTVLWSKEHAGKALSVQPVMRTEGLAQFSAFGRDYTQAAANAIAIAAVPELITERTVLIDALRKIKYMTGMGNELIALKQIEAFADRELSLILGDEGSQERETK